MNTSYTATYAKIVSLAQSGIYLVFTFDNNTEVKFSNNGFDPPKPQKFVENTKSGLPELHLTQGIKTLVIIYATETDLDNHWAVIDALIVTDGAVTIDPSSLSTLATLAEQQTQTTKLDQIKTGVDDLNLKAQNANTNFASGNYKIRLNSTADTVTTDSNIRSAGLHQTGNFFSCQLTVLTGTMTIDGVTYPQTTASGGKIDSVTFEAPAGWQHFDFTYTVNASSTVLEIITKSL